MYSKDWTVKDQIAVEAEWAMAADGNEDGYVSFVGFLDPKGSWQIHIEDVDGNKLRVATVVGSTAQEQVAEMAVDGKFDSGLKPEDIYRFLIEKW